MFSTSLTNYFDSIKDPTYKTEEINFLITKYNHIRHGISNEIIKLLLALLPFRAATDPNSKNKQSAQELEENFLTVAVAINITESYCDALPDDSQKKILMDAINYSKMSVSQRSKELLLPDTKVHELLNTANSAPKKNLVTDA